MARTAIITLDGKKFEVRALNLKELEEVMAALGDTNAGVSGMKVLRIAMRRADPKVENLDELEPTFVELNDATRVILKLSGIEVATDPQAAAPAGV